jgi:hypothetical protein
MLVETRPTRRFEFLGSEKFWAWGLAISFALAAIVALLALKPVTRFDYSAEQLTSAVTDKIEYGLYPVEKDDTGQQFRWMSDKVQLVFPVSSNQFPVRITFRLRSGRYGGNPASPTTTVSLNGVKLGALQPGLEYQDFTSDLKPPYSDDHRLSFTLDTGPTFSPPRDGRKLGNIIQSASVDISEVWSPVQRRGWLVWLFPLLAVGVAILNLLSRSKAAVAQVAGYGTVVLAAGASALSLFWLFLLSRVGYNGEANAGVFWLWTLGAGYLALFFGWTALGGLSWGQAGRPTLWTNLRGRFAPFVLAHPVLMALVGLFLVNAAVTGLFYAKVYFETGNLDAIVRYWDGPEYIVIANGFYDKNDPLLVIPDFAQHSQNYWTAHFPGYSLALRLVWYAIGWMAAGPVVNFIASSLFAFVFWKFLRDFGYASRPFWLAVVALVLPVRWLIYHSVGASEPLMLLFQMLSIYYFKKERYWLAGLAGGLALFVRPPGIFLWFGYLLWLAWEVGQKVWQEKKFEFSYVNWKAFWGLLPIPLTLPVVLGLYAWRYGDFLAYFHITENVTHVELLPFTSLATGADGGPGLFYYYLIQAVGLILLWKQGRIDLLCIGLGTFAYTVFLLHPDVLRYSLPAFPIIVAIPLAEYLTGKTARWLAIPVLMMVYLYSWGALNGNLAGLDTWQMMKNILH